MRLFYVQITRARDRLLLAGRVISGSILSEVVMPEVEALSAQGLLEVVADVAPLETVLPAAPRPIPDATDLSLSVTRARRSAPEVRLLEVPVTQVEDFALCPRRFRARHLLKLPEFPEARTPPSPEVDTDVAGDPRRRGTLAHAVLERLDFAHARTEPARALSRAMDRAGAPHSEDLVGRLTPFVSGEYASRLGELDPRRIERELPFSLAVEAGRATMILKGQIDLLVDRGDVLEVVDYKVTSPRGTDPTAPYRFQLGMYAEAVRRRVDGQVNVQAKVQFLDGKARLPVLSQVDDVSLVLPALGQSLLEARRSGTYEGREEPSCRAMGCGYVWLCHAEERGESDHAATR
jgi:ATP-dependent exoDNAse (exonuclease V) beta subunit